MKRRDFSLEDRYRVREGQVSLTGVQALVRLPIDQHLRDRAAGLKTATYISGYQGSPLGEFDKQIQRALGILQEHEVLWRAGINEDVAATSLYGSQLLDQFPQPRYDGVLGMWYGKAPGVDRTMDAFKHGQFVGTSRHGAALALAGDDPACKSSTLPCASEGALADANMPVLYPGNPQEVLELGLHGFALSRYTGLWVGLKMHTNVADGGGIIDVHPEQGMPRIPELEIDGAPFDKKQDVRLVPPYSVETERRIYYERLLAARAYARHNRLDRVTVGSGADRIGIVSAGKWYYDVLQALAYLGFGAEEMRQAGIRLYKMGMIHPVEPEGLKDFANGLDEVLVVEEKRGMLEQQVRAALFNEPERPAVYGKYDAQGRPMFPMHSELQVDEVARLLAPYLAEKLGRPDLLERVGWLYELAERTYAPIEARTPYFCSGCPHNTSTTVPEGSLAGGGIGCHAMAGWMGRGVTYYTQMGGEGAPWMGLAPFTGVEHLYQNIGDGTFFHSGSKALEACIASGVNMTYKILYNSASAMTGGQHVVGEVPTVNLAEQVQRMGAKEVVIVPEEMERYPRRRLGRNIRVEHRDRYNEVMRELREVPGVTVIIYDQECAAEKRRKRKRGIYAEPRKRVFINEGVCEGCGDCGVKSNCLSVVPVETDYGRKTAIHQSSCNLDYSCLKGDCPSFMTVELGEHTRPARKQGLASPLEAGDVAEPAQVAGTADPYNVLLVGIGGTGVVTADQLLITAALMDGKYAWHLDQTGLAQKGGPVLSNFIVCDHPIERSNKISAGETDALLGFDFLASVAPDNLHRYHPERTRAVVNTKLSATGHTVTDIHAHLPPAEAMQKRITPYLRAEGNVFVNTERMVDALFGNTVSANIFQLGVAYQAGLVPVSAESLERAIEVNGVAVQQNLQAFRWGRRYHQDAGAVERLLDGERAAPEPRAEALARLRRWAPGQAEALEGLAERFPGGGKLDAVLYPRVADLILYQSPAYAGQYLDFVRRVAEAEHQRAPGRNELAEAVSRWLFKLMAYKDEYEVARLWVQDPTWERVKADYDGPVKRYYHLHPPLLRAMGMQRKIRLGEWFTPMMQLLMHLKRLRGTPADVFGYASARRTERRLIGWYRGLIEELLPTLNHDNHGVAVQIANAPDGIRGYESVKQRTLAETEDEVARLLETYRQPARPRAAI